MSFGFNSAIWQLVKQSDWVSKYIVMLSLAVLSVACVAIIIHKFIHYRQHKIMLARLLAALRDARTLQDLVTINKQFHGSIGGTLVETTIEEAKKLLEEKKQLIDHSESDATITVHDISTLDAMINQRIDTIIFEQEEYLPLLGTAAATGPLMGLFGTIWGLIHAFVNISQERSADISTVAPGIAEALIATLAGLVVAIPALVAFNYYSNELRKIEARLAECGELMLLLCKKSFLLTQKGHDAKKTPPRSSF